MTVSLLAFLLVACSTSPEVNTRLLSTSSVKDEEPANSQLTSKAGEPTTPAEYLTPLSRSAVTAESSLAQMGVIEGEALPAATLPPLYTPEAPPQIVTGWQHYISLFDQATPPLRYEFDYPENWFAYPSENGQVTLQSYSQEEGAGEPLPPYARLDIILLNCSQPEDCLISGDPVTFAGMPGIAMAFSDPSYGITVQEVILQQGDSALHFTLYINGKADQVTGYRDILSYLLSTLIVAEEPS